MDTGVAFVLAAGTMTFGNEWLQTKGLNFRVPVATLLLAALDGGISAFDPKAGVAFGAIVFIGALTVPLNGKSPITELTSQLNQTGASKGKGK